MGEIRINGIDVHYQRFGAGPDIVLVHGLAANLAFWHKRIVPLLAGEYRVTVYDLRGHGLSGMSRSGYTVRDLTLDLHGIIEETGLEKVHLAGHSLGGAISLYYASLHPERVSSLTLIDTRIQSLQPFKYANKDEYWEAQRGMLGAKGISIDDDMPKIFYKLLEELTPLIKAGVANPNVIAGVMTNDGEWNPRSRSAKRWKELTSKTTFRDDIVKTAGLTRKRIRGVKAPALLAYGGDSFCLETLRGLEALLPDFTTVIHPGLGHFYPAVAPEKVAGDIKAFISGVSPAQKLGFEHEQKNISGIR